MVGTQTARVGSAGRRCVVSPGQEVPQPVIPAVGPLRKWDGPCVVTVDVVERRIGGVRRGVRSWAVGAGVALAAGVLGVLALGGGAGSAAAAVAEPQASVPLAGQGEEGVPQWLKLASLRLPAGPVTSPAPSESGAGSSASSSPSDSASPPSSPGSQPPSSPASTELATTVSPTSASGCVSDSDLSWDSPPRPASERSCDPGSDPQLLVEVGQLRVEVGLGLGLIVIAVWMLVILAWKGAER
jgi:hypothetical protein